MNNHIGDKLQKEVRALYKSDERIQAFFVWAANRANDAAETSVDRISQVANASYAEARAFAKELCEIGCGEFIIGRKGWKSRIRWEVSLRSLGKAAKGDADTIDTIDPELAEDVADQQANSSDAGSVLTIAEAKRRLALALGVKLEAIEITVRA